MRRAPRLVVRRAALLLAACSIAAAAHGATWSDLWLRSDQQAQALLDAGRAAAAAPLFNDPQRRAYAEIKAQQYAGAAKRLQGLQDPEAQYNRGNALARGRELPAALQAYESALKQAPHDTPLYRDALHNHELVAKQLKQQPQAGGQTGQDQDKSQNRDQRGDQDRSGNQNQSADQKQGGDQKQGADQKQSDDQSHRGDQDPHNDSAQSQSQARNGQSSQAQSSRDAPPAGAASKDDAASKDQGSQAQSAAGHDRQQAQSSSKAAAAAAEADARAAMQSAQNQARAGVRAIPGQDARGADAKGQTLAGGDAKPESEQALALEQWLRWIPDDPSGLLRRKFVIEHMMKQREAQR